MVFVVERLRCFRDGVGVGVGPRRFLIFVPGDSSAASGAAIAPNKIAAMIKSRSIALIAGKIKISRRVPEGQLCLAGSRHRDFPAENFRSANARGNPARQSPIRRVSIPKMLRKSETIGMLPPSRISATSALNALRNARCAASPPGECGSVRYHGPLWPSVMSSVTPLGKFFRKCSLASARISSPSWFGTRRNVSFAIA